MDITSSYTLDALNFFNVLTGEALYVERYADAYQEWSGRLTAADLEAVQAAARDFGSAMLGPHLCLVVSAVPGFDSVPLPALLADTETLERHFRASVYYDPAAWPRSTRLCESLASVAATLEGAGLREHWKLDRLPLIEEGIERLRSFDRDVDLEGEIAGMLGRHPESDEDMVLYLCSFAAPHGIRISGRAYISDVRFSPATTLRIAIHEMFHPPLAGGEAASERGTLIGDSLFQEAFHGADPRFGYTSEEGFLEENIVEAMELFVSSRVGLIDDPRAYLLEHDGGSHKLSLVLLDAFGRVPRRAGEAFGEYFRRVVAALPVGSLHAEYERLSTLDMERGRTAGPASM